MRLEKTLIGLAALLLLGGALAPPLGPLRPWAVVLGLAAAALELVLLAPRIPDAVWVQVVLTLTRVRGAARERTVLALAQTLVSRGDIPRALLLCRQLAVELERRRNGDLLRSCLSVEAAALLESGDGKAAFDGLRRARRLGPLSAQATATLARLLAAAGRLDGDAVVVCCEHLRASGIAADPRVVDALQRACRVDDIQSDAAAFGLNQQVAEAAPRLAWAQSNLGLLLLRRGEVERAKRHLERAAPEDPHAAYLLHLCEAREAEGQGDLPRALQTYRALTAKHADRPEAFCELARILVEGCLLTQGVDDGGRWADEATRAAARACELRPGDAAVHAYLGRAHLLARRPTQAVEALQRAVSLDLDHSRWLARALLEAGDGAAAAKAAALATQRHPNDPDAWVVLADTQLHAGRNDDAGQSLQRALACSPQAHGVRSRLAHLEVERGHFREALHLLAALPARTPLDDLALGRCHAAVDDFAAAVQAYERALAVTPDLPRAHYHLGCAYAHQRRHDDAVKALSVAIERAPTEPSAYVQRGHCHLSTGASAMAVADYRRALALAPHDPSVSFCLARGLVATGAHGEALGLLRPLLALWADDADLHLLVGRLSEAADPKEARVHYECALRLRPGWDKGLVRLGVLLCHQGSDAEAAGFLEQAVKAGQSTREALFHLGLALGRSGRLAEAAQAWGRLPAQPRLAVNLRRLRRAQGAAAMRSGDPAAALKVWEPLLAQGRDEGLPADMAEAHLQLGLAVLEKGDRRIAARHLSEAVKLDPVGHAVADLYLALLPLHAGDAAASASRLAQVQLGGDAQARVDYHRGLALLAASTDIPQAVELLARAAENPLVTVRGYPVHQLLAHALVRAGRLEEALAHAPRWAPDLHAWCLARLDRPAEALAVLSSSGATSAGAEHLRGVLLARQGRMREAVEHLANAGEPAQDDLVRVLQAWTGACAAKRDHAGAGEALALARRLVPEAAPLEPYHRALAPHMTMALLRAGRREDAIRACEQSMREAPGDMRATHTLGLMYFWWALDLEARGVASLADSAWDGAIRNLVALSHADAWWERRRLAREKVCGAAGDATWQQLRGHLLEHLRRRILDMRNESANQQRGESQRRFDRLALKLSVETVSAAELAEVMRLCPPGRASRLVLCGVGMLRHLRQVQAAERLLARARSRVPAAAATERLHWCLSKCARPWMLVEEKRFDEAIAILRQMVDNDGGSVDANDLLARALYERGQALLPVAAAADDGQCGAVAAERALALFRKARLHVRERTGILGDIDMAAEEVGVSTATVLVRAPGIAPVERAVSILSQVQSISNSPRVRDNLAEVLAVLGVRVATDDSQPEAMRLYRARQHLQRALELNPQNGYARRNMAAVLWQHALQAFIADRYKEAVDLLCEAKKLDPTDPDNEKLMSDVLTHWAVERWRQGERKVALEMVRDALRLNPENAHARDLSSRMRGGH